MIRRWWPAGLLLLVALLGWLAVQVAPSGTHAGDLFPVGLASAVLLVAGRRAWFYLLAMAPIAFAALVLGGRPVDVAAASAVGVAAEATVVWLVLTAGGATRPRLRTFADLDRYAAAAVLGAGTGAVIGAVAAAITGFGDPALTSLAIGSSHLSSQLVILPFFLHPLAERATADRWEQVLAWFAVVAVTPLVFLADGLPALGFLVMPLLVWGALRLGTWQALSQVLTVAVIASGLYAWGRGPLTWVPPGVDQRADAATVLLQLFIIGCALVVIPLVLVVSLRRGADREAASERDKLARVVDAARGVAIIGTDRVGRVTLFNPGAERLLGWRRSEVLGRHATTFCSESSIGEKAEQLGVAADCASLARRLVAADQARTVMRLRRRDGEERAHLVTLSEILDDRDQVAGYLSTSEDVTEQLRTQEATERALHRMKEVDSLKDAFISTVSHELRTPITSIVGYLELLSDGHFGELSIGQSDAVGRIESNSARLLVLIDDLLTLARMQDVLAPVDQRSRVPMGQVVRRGVAVASPQADAHAVALACEVPRSEVWVVGDRDALEGVVINLVGNAVKFTPDGGSVVIALVRDGDEAVLSVTDTGIGIPEDELDLLFARFFRSSVTLDRAIPGSGLGLSIAQGVVQAHDGSISVESKIGVGTTFTVRLPLAAGVGAR